MIRRKLEMPDTKDRLQGVKCSAVACRYQCPGYGCQARGIDVGSENSATSSDTYCATFDPQDFAKYM